MDVYKQIQSYCKWAEIKTEDTFFEKISLICTFKR